MTRTIHLHDCKVWQKRINCIGKICTVWGFMDYWLFVHDSERSGDKMKISSYTQ